MIDTMWATPSTAWLMRWQRRRVAVIVLLMLLASLFYARLTLAMGFGSLVVLVVWAALVSVVWQPRVGLLVAVAGVSFFDNGGIDEIMDLGYQFYAGMGNWVNLGGILPSPLESVIFLAATVLLVRGLVQHRMDFRGGVLVRPMLFWASAIGLGMIRGFAGRAALNSLLWESRFLVLMVVCYFLVTNTIRTREHIRSLVTVCLLTMTLFGLEVTYRKVALVDTGRMGTIKEFAFSHEGVVFWAVLILLVVAQQAFGAPPWQRYFGRLGLFVCAFALMASERRSGQMSLIIGFLVLSLVLAVVNRKAFFAICLPVLLAFLVYLPIFWNASGTFAQPARAIRSLYQPDPRDAASNLYREMEKVNIFTTIRSGSNRLFGVGFGRPFIVVVQMVDMSWWPFWNMQPHNNIMWLWLKTGPLGFIAFWTLTGTALMRAAHQARYLSSNEGRGLSLVGLCAVVVCLVFNYVDLGFTGARVCVLYGTMLGLVGVLDHIYGRQSAATEGGLVTAGAAAGGAGATVAARR